MAYNNILRIFANKTSINSCRSKSDKFFKPHPRSYKRRLFEAALKPILPSEIEAKKQRLTYNEVYSFFKESNKEVLNIFIKFYFQYSNYDLGEVSMIKEWIRDEKYRMIGICQLLYVKENQKWLAQNQ